MQNSELKRELLGPHREVSASELENYLSGKLSASEARAVEEKLHSNEFSSSAAEGFSTYGSTSTISEIGKQWSTPNHTWMAWSVFSALLLLTIGFWWIGKGTTEVSTAKKETNDNISPTTELIEDNQKTNKTEKVADIPFEKSREEITEPNSKKIVAETGQIKEDLVVEDEPVLFYKGMEAEVFKLKPLLMKTGDLNLAEQSLNLKNQKARLRHYKNYKLVDQGIGIDQSLLKPLLTGTEPFKETIEINPKYPEWMPADSVYKASLNEAIDWLIEENYSSAIMRFRRLVQNTPEDLTANFYLGYTLFLNDDYDKAITYLKKAQNHIIQTFDQDARFIELKCLIQLGRNDEALEKALFLKKSKSFYADRAMELVE